MLYRVKCHDPKKNKPYYVNATTQKVCRGKEVNAWLYECAIARIKHAYEGKLAHTNPSALWCYQATFKKPKGDNVVIVLASMQRKIKEAEPTIYDKGLTNAAACSEIRRSALRVNIAHSIADEQTTYHLYFTQKILYYNMQRTRDRFHPIIQNRSRRGQRGRKSRRRRNCLRCSDRNYRTWHFRKSPGHRRRGWSIFPTYLPCTAAWERRRGREEATHERESHVWCRSTYWIRLMISSRLY